MKPGFVQLIAVTFMLGAVMPSPSLGQSINEDHKLVASDSEVRDLFGSSIAVDNGIVAVGAEYHDLDKDNRYAGAVYLFSTHDGQELAKITASDASQNNNFGDALAMDDGLLVVSGGGVYIIDAETQTELSILRPDDGYPEGFGHAVAIDDGIVAVSAYREDDNGDDSGSAYLFDAASGQQLFKLLPDDGAESDYFGYSIAIDDGVVAVGAVWDDDLGENSGAVYLFDASTGLQIDKLLPVDGQQFDRFGESVAIANGVVAVGALEYEFSPIGRGKSYIFDVTDGTQIAKLVPPEPDYGPLFGISIAIDNGVVVVGSVYDNESALNSGAAYIFDAQSGAYLTQFLASDGDTDDYFGNSVAVDGGTIAVGAWRYRFKYDGDDGPGKAYIFKNLLTTNLDQKLLAQDGQPGDLLGRSIAIDDSIIAIGASKDQDNGTNSGSAYILDKNTGAELAKILPTDGAAGDRFGVSIALSNNRIAVGASRDDDNGPGSGSAYVFDTSDANQLFKLLPDDGATADNFGFSVAMDSSVIAVGSYRDDDFGNASGSVYLFDPASGTQLTKVTPSDAAADDQFGYSIAIDNGIIAIGSIQSETNGVRSGAVYLFDTSGMELRKLIPEDLPADAQFGCSVSIRNGIVAVGANEDSENGTDSGSAYIFDANTGVQIAKLLPSDGAPSDFFGSSIAISDIGVVVGSSGDDFFGNDSGSAYLFDTSTGAYITKYRPSIGAPDAQFGNAIAASSSTIAIGAWQDPDNGNNAGSVYKFSTTIDQPCPADLNTDGALNFLDVSLFLSLFASEDSDADFTSDGSFNFLDLSEFLAQFAAGCP